MKIAGILGGLGPQSTALFYEEIIRLAQSRQQVEYPRMIINSMSVWDFSNRMNDHEALFELVSAEISRIESQVDFLAMVCNTAHCILEPLRNHSKKPLLAIQEEVVKKIRKDGLKKVGILGTRVTTGTQIYQRELDKHGIASLCLPDRLQDSFNQLIFDEMLHGSGYDKMETSMGIFVDLLVEQGCEGVILGCTELPLFISQEEVSVPLYASTQILAESVSNKCLER